MAFEDSYPPWCQIIFIGPGGGAGKEGSVTSFPVINKQSLGLFLVTPFLAIIRI